MSDVERALTDLARRYLKTTYGEDTVAMTVTRNGVREGNGDLAVDCTVSVGGARSDWSKVFHFRGGAIAGMDYRRR